MQVAELGEPSDVILAEEVVEEVAGDELVCAPVGFKQRGCEAGLLHALAHDAYAAALGFSETSFMQYCRDLGVARLGTGFTQMLGRLEREAGIADFQPVGVANDLYRTVAAIAAVHQGIDQRFADDAQRNHRLVLSLQFAFGQTEVPGQIIQHGSLGTADQAEQRVAQFDGIETAVGVGHPFSAWHPDIIDASHGKTAAQGRWLAEQDQASDGRPPFAFLIAANTAERLQQFLVGPAQLFGIWVGFTSGFSVVGNGIRRKVVHFGIGDNAGIEAFLLTALVEDGHVVVGAMLICTADATECPSRQSLCLEENRLVLRLSLWDEDHDDVIALHIFDGDIHSNRNVEDIAALVGNVGHDLVRVRNALDFIGWKKHQFFSHDAEHDPAAAQARLIGKGTDSFENGFAYLGTALGLDTLVLIKEVEAFEQLDSSHARASAVTLRSSLTIPSSARFRSASQNLLMTRNRLSCSRMRSISLPNSKCSKILRTFSEKPLM